MEQVLDVYKRPYDDEFPVVGMDESPTVNAIKYTASALLKKPHFHLIFRTKQPQ
jgi:hypothetical protein